jgi:asparagine synthase (glutamine-hydrolysing)
MCGIAGRYNFRSGAPVDATVIGGMTSLLAHRGPDGQGVFTDGAIGLGHRRLAIIDLSDGGRQPMASADRRLWIPFNGEIYNCRELRKILEGRGHRVQSRSDTEVILAAYAQWGAACLKHLRGMFALAIWDSTERRLFIARDRLGKKPLFYRLDNDGIAFASEPKAFLAEPGFQAVANPQALSHYLSYQYVPSPLSAFAGVSKLAPAHCLVVGEGAISSPQKYWTLQYEPKQTITEESACEELLTRLREATRLRMISDVPLGAFLSGGVDSSAVVALMAAESSQPVKTFSIGFEESGFDELEYARLVAKRYATDHHEFVVRPDAAAIFDRLVWHYNEPFADPSAIPTYYLAELTRRHVTVALNGDAGDENFAGYDRYVAGGFRARYERVPKAARAALGAIATTVPPGLSRGAFGRGRRLAKLSALPDASQYAVDMMQVDPWLRRELCTPEFLALADIDDPAAIVADEFLGAAAREPLDRKLAADVSRYLPDALLVKVDIASMAHGLECRSPLLDHQFMEFAATLPIGCKRRGAVSKYIFKRAVRDLVPHEILDRPKKGFSVPIEVWFRRELRELASDVLLDRRAAERGLVRRAVVARLLDEHAKSVRNWHEQIWNLLMLEMWHRMFIDARPTADRVQVAPQVVQVV